MDSLKQLFTSTQGGTETTPSTAGTIAGLGSLGAGGFGTISNIINAFRQAGVSSDLQSQMKMLMMLANNPTLLAQKAQALETPLSQNLLNNVGNSTQAILGERGLSSSPAQAQQITAQTLAPYELQEQQDAMNALQRQFQLPIQAASGIKFPQTNASSFWQMLLPKPATQGAQPASTTGNYSAPTPETPTPSSFTGTPPDTGGGFDWSSFTSQLPSFGGTTP